MMNNDLISRDALMKEMPKLVMPTPFHTSIIYAEKVLEAIANAPAVEYTFEEAFQKTVCDNELYCPAKLKNEKFAEIEKVVNDFMPTRDVPLVERAYSETDKIEKAECFNKILDILSEL